MADKSSNNTSGPRDWRQRVGVKGKMPKLADEFKSDPKFSEQPSKSNGGAAETAPESKKPATKQVASPAPMAPRLPGKTASNDKKPDATGNSESSDAKAGPGGTGSDFGDRLRAQREAAEALAKKRAEETRDRLSGLGKPKNTPKFSFAAEELKAAEVEKAKPQSPPAGQATPRRRPTPPPRRPPFRPGGNTGTRPYQPSEAYHQTHGYRRYGEQLPDPVAPPPPARPPVQDQYAESAPEQRAYEPPRRDNYQVPPSRSPSPRYIQENDDDLFDDRDLRDSGRPQAPRRPDASDYTAAYRDYDDAFEYEEEPRKKGGLGIFIFLMLLVVAAIAAGAYWFINYGTKIGSQKTGSGNVPTVSAPENPVKVEPAPAEATTPAAPVKRKKIYDRILGDQTLEPEKLVPSEEQPQTPPPTAAPTPAPTNEAPVGVEPLPLPLPPPPTVPGTQGSAPEPTNQVAGANTVLPQAGSTTSSNAGQTSIAPTVAKEITTPVQPAGTQAPLPLPPVSTGGDTTVGLPTPTTSTPETAAPEVAETAPPPLPRSKPVAVIARARQAAEQQRLAALTQSVTPVQPAVPTAPRQALPGGTGPVQIAPGTSGGQNFNTTAPVAPATPVQPALPQTNIASLPQPSQVPAAPQPQASPGSGYVLQMSSFRNRNAASAEYRRLVSRHSSILSGLSPEIREADLGASGKFYKLRLGSVADRTQASRLCNSLIAAGEKDCLVRSR